VGMQPYPTLTQVVVELEGGEGGPADMAGDAGVVGRWLVQGGGGAQPQLQLDLKGVLYNAALARGSPARPGAGCSMSPACRAPWGCTQQQTCPSFHHNHCVEARAGCCVCAPHDEALVLCCRPLRASSATQDAWPSCPAVAPRSQAASVAACRAHCCMLPACCAAAGVRPLNVVGAARNATRPRRRCPAQRRCAWWRWARARRAWRRSVRSSCSCARRPARRRRRRPARLAAAAPSSPTCSCSMTMTSTRRARPWPFPPSDLPQDPQSPHAHLS
jgi:hypothetical protein